MFINEMQIFNPDILFMSRETLCNFDFEIISVSNMNNICKITLTVDVKQYSCSYAKKKIVFFHFSCFARNL